MDPEWTSHEAMPCGLRVTMFLVSVWCATHGVDPEWAVALCRCCYGRVADCVGPELTSRAVSGLGLDLDCLNGLVCPNARYG